jgi:hypothetical protein
MPAGTSPRRAFPRPGVVGHVRAWIVPIRACRPCVRGRSCPGWSSPVFGTIVMFGSVACALGCGRHAQLVVSACGAVTLCSRGRLCVRRVASVFQCGRLYVGNGCHVRLWSLRGRVGCRVGGVGAGRVVVHRPTLTRSTFGSRSNRLEIGGIPAGRVSRVAWRRSGCPHGRGRGVRAVVVGWSLLCPDFLIVVTVDGAVSRALLRRVASLHP